MSQCYAAQHSYVPLLSLRRDSPPKSSPTFSVRPRSSVGRVMVDLFRRSWVRFPPRPKDFFFASCGSLIPLLGLTPSGLFMGLSSTSIYTSELILCSTICVPVLRGTTFIYNFIWFVIRPICKRLPSSRWVLLVILFRMLLHLLLTFFPFISFAGYNLVVIHPAILVFPFSFRRGGPFYFFKIRIFIALLSAFWPSGLFGFDFVYLFVFITLFLFYMSFALLGLH